MNRITSLVRRHQLAMFFGLAYTLSWLPSLTEAHSIFPLGPLIAALIMLAISLWWIWGALWVVVAIALVLVVGPSLAGRRSAGRTHMVGFSAPTVDVGGQAKDLQ